MEEREDPIDPAKALARVKVNLANAPGFVESHPADIVAVCDLVPVDDHTRTVRDLRLGCAGLAKLDQPPKVMHQKGCIENLLTAVARSRG